MSNSQTRLSIKITSQKTNCNFSSVISLNGNQWDVRFAEREIHLKSRKEFPISDNDDELITIMDQIVGHVKNITVIALGLNMKMGYEASTVATRYLNEELIFLSIHQNSSTEYSKESLDVAEKIIKDIGSTRKRGAKSLLNYWRRAFELDELGFDSESFLNHYKIIEVLAELSTGNEARDSIINRFCPRGIPQVTLCNRYKADDINEKRKLCGRIRFIAKALGSSGVDSRISRDLFVKLLDIIYMRNGWNIAHKLVRSNIYDEYSSIGQHSDEFKLVNIENIYIANITKLLILLYIKPGMYKFSMQGNYPWIVPAN